MTHRAFHPVGRGVVRPSIRCGCRGCVREECRPRWDPGTRFLPGSLRPSLSSPLTVAILVAPGVATFVGAFVVDVPADGGARTVVDTAATVLEAVAEALAVALVEATDLEAAGLRAALLG